LLPRKEEILKESNRRMNAGFRRHLKGVRKTPASASKGGYADGEGALGIVSEKRGRGKTGTTASGSMNKRARSWKGETKNVTVFRIKVISH